MSNSVMKKRVLIIILFFTSFFSNAQQGYNITINLKNINDTIAYLTFYQFDKTLIKDTCTTIKNGKIVFSGKKKLDKGIYSLVSQGKSIYFDFFIDDSTQNLELSGENGANIAITLKASNSPISNEFFDYLKFLGRMNNEFLIEKQKLNGLVKKDSISKLKSIQKQFEEQILDREKEFISKNKSSYIADVINIKSERVLRDVPLAKNGRPDSIAAYNYYKKHYWDDVDFKDNATMRNPFFNGKFKKYFDNVVTIHPDSMIVAVDKIMAKATEGSLLYKLMLANLTYTFESSKIMGFDKVFVHISDNYFKKGKAAGIYESEDVVQKIIKRADKLKPLLIGAIAPELFMIKAENIDKIDAMGFEKAKNSDEMTKIFYDNIDAINKLFFKLSDVKTDYTIVVFWDVDCGHCQKEIPKLQEVYHELKEKNKSIEVFSVYMQHEGDKYKKYIAEHKLDWINVYDGCHYNNAIEKYDVYSTPVIYILDKNKKIKAKRIGVEQIKPLLEEFELEQKK
jgi:thiol-disulfide isomerase/thioredoxin